jgi:hypothetical protein
VAFLSPAQAQQKPTVKLPTGEYHVSFLNGVSQKCQLTENGNVKVSQAKRSATGKIEIEDGKIIVHYDDDRLELWSEMNGAYQVNHWHPASAYPKLASNVGTAEKHLEGKLEVHEWGTFTILQGSDGKAIPWYQAPQKLVDLPPFVQQQIGAFSKARPFFISDGLDSVRMETPVLYFYPEKAMDVRVAANFPTGRITEVFPPVAFQFNSGPSQALWRGTLLPPDAAEKSRVPIATGEKGRHYAAARAVPGAWLYSQITPQTEAALKRAKEAQKKNDRPAALPVEPIDHFIFYRGAGKAENFPIRAVEQEAPGTYKLSSFYHQTIPKLFALRVADGKSTWTAIDQLNQVKYDSKAQKTLNQQDLVFPEATNSTEEVAAELRDAMVAALHAEGLTMDEAKAMVATWDNLWFTDPGTRVLALLPQSYADQMVPLQISPKPTKIERVFVARLELINKAQEQTLTTVLDPLNGMDEKIASEKLAALNLGRYSAGGMARAKSLINAQIERRFSKLEELQNEKEDSKTASTR